MLHFDAIEVYSPPNVEILYGKKMDKRRSLGKPQRINLAF